MVKNEQAKCIRVSNNSENQNDTLEDREKQDLKARYKQFKKDNKKFVKKLLKKERKKEAKKATKKAADEASKSDDKKPRSFTDTIKSVGKAIARNAGKFFKGICVLGSICAGIKKGFDSFMGRFTNKGRRSAV